MDATRLSVDLPRCFRSTVRSPLAINFAAWANSPVTGQLRRIHNPDYEAQWSFTAWLYHRYGRVVGIGVFLAIAALTIALRIWLF